MTLEGKTAIITGGGRGIGRAIATVFAQRGARLALAGRSLEPLTGTAQELSQAYGQEVLAIQADVANLESARALVDQVVKAFGRVDILVNNAGITRDNLIMRMDETDFDEVIATNLKGAWNCCKAVIRQMIKQRSGRIVNISSVSGLAGQVGQTNYSAAKAGMIGLTKSLAREVASRQITVNVVAPGLVPTDLTHDLAPEVQDAILKATPLGRLGKPEEVAYAAAFLASDEAAYITGQVLCIDGGMTMM